jgi:hypothetical protein
MPKGFSEVVVSGGGDGAMQDFQRVATGLFGKKLFEAFESATRAIPQSATISPQPILPDQALLNHFLCADDAGRRACCWFQNNLLSAALADWHAAFQRRIEQIADGSDAVDLAILAKGLFRPEVLRGSLNITWVVKDPAPGAAYALNRYLCLLLLALAKRTLPSNWIKLFPNAAIVKISSVDGHRCGNAGNCMGKQHLVRIAVDDGPNQEIFERHADLIILRHGLHKMMKQKGQRNRLLGGLPPVPNQMVPFRIPSDLPTTSLPEVKRPQEENLREVPPHFHIRH